MDDPDGTPGDPPTETPRGDFEGPEWMRGVGNFDGVVDRTGESEVAVLVGAEGNGGQFAFSPPAVAVDPGTEVRWRWVSNVPYVGPREVPDASDWSGHPRIEEGGHTYSHVFEHAGTYEYYCEPHGSLGMKGLVRVEE